VSAGSAGGAHDDHGHDHGHGHSPFIQHHYDDAQHQFDSGKLGIWLFLAQEVLFFSALFVAYILYRHHHPEIYGYAHKYLDVKFGAINTAVLIFSSLTAAWAVRAAQLRQKRLLILCLGTTIACACTFLVIKYIEYNHKVHEHLLFGRYFDPCIAANESPLVTKNNECPGSKGSVVWDYDKSVPLTGCYPVIALDQKPKEEGVQPSCKVREVVVEPATTPKGEPVIDPDSKLPTVLEKAGTAKPIDKMCPEHEEGEGEGEGEHGGEACWRTSYQPAVCHPGWFYMMRCTGGDSLASAATDAKQLAGQLPDLKKNAEAAKKALDEARALDPTAPQVAELACKLDDATFLADDAEWRVKEAPERLRLHDKFCGPTEQFSVSHAFGDRSECSDGSGKRRKALNELREREIRTRCVGQCGAALEDCKKVHANDPDLTTFVLDDCVRSEQVGFVVEHHDHEVRPREQVVAPTCEAPPKPGKQEDVFADKEQTLHLGTASAGHSHAASAHASHEAIYAGPPPEHTNMFFTIYFAMTGLHGIHVLVGVFVFIWLLIRAIKGHFTPEYFGPVDWAALYWHIVDLIWIFLFPLMYLIH